MPLVDRKALAIVCLLSALTPAYASAQDTFRWPERGQNLQVLPADFPPDRLSAVMRGFTQALGVRCSHCHVGEEGQPLSTFDFPSDAKPAKATARKMYTMLGDINKHLDGIQRSGEPVNMWCHTCHNGLPRPQTLSEALGETWAAEGIEATLARYAELRETYRDTGAFDFSDGSLVDLIRRTRTDHIDDAVAIARLQAEQYPESWSAWMALGEMLAEGGDVAGAIAALERSVQLESRSPGRALLERLRAQQ